MKIGHPISYLPIIFCCSSHTSSPHSDSSSFLFPSSLMFFSDCRKYNHHCLQTQAHNFFAKSYVQTHSYFCVYVFTSVYVFTCICVYQLYTSIRVQVRKVSVCETRLARMNFLYFFTPSTDENVVLQQLSALSSHILPCSMLCGYPWRTILVVCKSHFPYLKYLILVP